MKKNCSKYGVTFSCQYKSNINLKETIIRIASIAIFKRAAWLVSENFFFDLFSFFVSDDVKIKSSCVLVYFFHRKGNFDMILNFQEKNIAFEKQP